MDKIRIKITTQPLDVDMWGTGEDGLGKMSDADIIDMCSEDPDYVLRGAKWEVERFSGDDIHNEIKTAKHLIECWEKAIILPEHAPHLRGLSMHIKMLYRQLEALQSRLLEVEKEWGVER